MTDWPAGVLAGGELGFDSVAFSVLELAAAGEALLAGASSIRTSGSKTARNFSGATLRVTILEEAAALALPAAAMPEFRRSLLDGVAFLDEGAMANGSGLLTKKNALLVGRSLECGSRRNKERVRFAVVRRLKREVKDGSFVFVRMMTLVVEDWFASLATFAIIACRCPCALGPSEQQRREMRCETGKQTIGRRSQWFRFSDGMMDGWMMECEWPVTVRWPVIRVQADAQRTISLGAGSGLELMAAFGVTLCVAVS